MKPSRPSAPDLLTLVGLFYADPAELGQFTEVSAESMPEVFRGLLAHNKHMTVTVESFHGSPVDVQVLQTLADDSLYARKILLSRQSDGGVVQYGIVRLNFQYVSPEVRAEIESQRIPLGRVLIEHNVLREVQLSTLWQVAPGPDLQRLLRVPASCPVYGRTALIYFHGEPAVELLEIVTPA